MFIENPEDLIGFSSKADQGAGLALFLEYGAEAAYDSLQGNDYLLGSVAYKAHVYDLITGEIKDIETYTARLKPAQETNSDGTPYSTLGFGSTYIGRPGPLTDGYYNYPFYYFYYVVGDVYKTVDGKIIDDTPVAPADIPVLMNSMINMNGSIFKDGAFGETGVVTAKRDRVVASIDQMWNNGWGGEAYLQGFSPISINRRMTYKALGEGYNPYIRIDKYGLAAGDGGGVQGKSSVYVWAIKEFNGRVMVAHVACDDGGGKQLKTSAQVTNSWNLVQPAEVLKFFGDSNNTSQHYRYTLIYHENSSNTGKSANDRSYAMIYVYDFLDEEVLRSKNYNPKEALNVYGLEVEGKTTLEDALAAAAEADVKEAEEAAAAAAALEAAANANPTPTNLTNYISADRIIAYVPLDGDVTTGSIIKAPATGVNTRGEMVYDLGKYHKGISLKAGHISIPGFRPKTGDFTLAAWVKSENLGLDDPVIFGNKDWGSGANKGFLLCFNGNAQIKFNIGDGSGKRDDHGFAFTNSEDWTYILFTVDRANHKVGLSVNFGELQWYTYNSDFGDEQWNGVGEMRFGNDTTDRYSRIPGFLDDALAFKGVATADDIAALQNYYNQ